MLELIDDLYAARARVDTAIAVAGAARWATGDVLIGGAGLQRETVAARWSSSAPRSTGAATIVGRFLGFETAGDVEITLDKLDTDMAVFDSELAAAIGGAATLSVAPRRIVAIARYLKAKDAYTRATNKIPAIIELASAKERLDAEGVDASGDLAAQLDQMMAQLSPLARFYLSVWSPFIERWRTFYEKNRTWFANFMRDNRGERDGYLEQLKELRQTARSLGVAIASPDPTTPPASPFDQLLSFVKILMYGSLLIGGAFAIAMLWRAWRA